MKVNYNAAVYRTFSTQTEEGITEAERFKAELENKGYAVTVQPVGLTRVLISGKGVAQG